MDIQDLERRFAYHPPLTEDVKLGHEQIRDRCLGLARDLNQIVPEGREKATMMTKLEEVMMWGNAGVARAKQADPLD